MNGFPIHANQVPDTEASATHGAIDRTLDGWRLVHIHYSGSPTAAHLEGF